MSQQSEVEEAASGRSRRLASAAQSAGKRARAKTASNVIARAVERKTAEVDVRRMPRQARGAVTFTAILDATARLLDEAGAEVITTNLVAEVAGVNIATLYQYFPSKESILLALFQRDTDTRIRLAGEMLLGLGDADDWRQQLAGVIDELVRQRRVQRGAGPLRRAMRSSPELQAYDRDALVHSARALAAELVKRGRADAARAEIAGLCIAELGTALLDLWALGYAGGRGYQDGRIVEEFKAMVIGYLAPLLDP